MQSEEQRASTIQFVFGRLVGRIKESFSDGNQIGLHLFHFVERYLSQDVFDVVQISGAESHTELRPVEHICERIMRSISEEYRDASRIDRVLYTEAPT